VLQGLQANEPAVRKALSGKRYVHLATHALVGGGREALFASLVLTPSTVAPRETNADGFLQLHEIYDLKLPDVELAVLSACETNRSANLEGEGVFALSRGFIAAGARRVVASQWAVDDASTAVLMGAMFEQVVAARRAGRTVDFAKALREAKLRVRSRPEWSDPYHWAPFVLTGVQ
jgi:CHAT domain-containing protein